MTRQRYLNPNCITDSRALEYKALYNPGDCYGKGYSERDYVEAIAHARGVARANARLGLGRTQVHPNLQWEPRLKVPGNQWKNSRGKPFSSPVRADLIRYDASGLGPNAGQVELVEYKRADRTDGLDYQLRIYENSWPGDGEITRSAKFARDIAGDTFDVRMTCDDGSERTDTWQTNPGPVAGSVLVSRTWKTDCGSDDDPKRVDADEKLESEFDPAEGEPLPSDDESSDMVDESEFGGSGCTSWWMCIDDFGVTLPDWGSIDWGALAFAALLTILKAIPQVRAALLTSTVLRLALSRISASLFSNVLGDPHLTTVDGFSYPLQSVGEFVLSKSITDQPFEIQARFEPLGGSTTASTATAYAMDVNGKSVELRPSGELKVDGDIRTMVNDSYIKLGDGSAIFRVDSKWLVIWPGVSDRPMVIYDPAINDIRLYLPDAMRTQGLLGNNDNVKTNDLRVRNGAQLSAATSAQTIHGPFADSWRVTQAEALFEYASNESTASYSDLSFPTNVVTVDQFPVEDRADAELTCRDAGVREGSAMRACVYDRLVSESDDFIDAAVAVTIPGTAAADKVPDSSGVLEEDFEGFVPPNLNYGRLGSDQGYGGSFAGPMRERDSYGFSTLSKVSRSGVTVGLDLVVSGDWSDGAPQVVDVVVDGEVVRSAEVVGDTLTEEPTSAELGSPIRSGTLTSGDRYWVFRVEATSDSASLGEFTGEVRLEGPSKGRAFGVDNLRIAQTLVEPQRFELEVDESPFRVEDGTPGDGAGNLETGVSVDRYEIEVPTDGTILAMDRVACDASEDVTWRLATQTDATVESGTCQSGARVKVDTGTYNLTFYSPGQDAGEYSVDIYFAPAAQAFNLTLSESPTSVTTNSPAAGAGRLETKASRDVYEFSVSAGKKVVLEGCSMYGTRAQWRLIDSSGDVVESNPCYVNRTFSDLSAGSYKLEVSENGQIGDYGLKLFYLPEPDTADVTLTTSPLTIDSDSMASGIGTLETSKSMDRIRFTVPSGGKSVAVDFTSCPLLLWGKWSLYERGSNKSVASGICATDARVRDVEAGDYELTFESSYGGTGDYSLDVYFQPAPDVFDVELTTTPVTLSSAVYGSGAGLIETPASVDVYRFEVDQGSKKLRVENKSCPNNNAANDWALVDRSSGETVTSDYCFNSQTVELDEGSYELRVTSRTRHTGAYEMDLSFVPEPDVFQIDPANAAVSVSDGTPEPGAGNIESLTAVDQYRFSVPAGGRSLYLDNKECVFNNVGINWRLVDRGTGDQVAHDHCGSDRKFTDLPAGNYQLEYLRSIFNKTGTYKFDLLVVPEPQEFSLSLSTSITSVSEGAPGPGAGKLETAASVDRYTFAVPSGGRDLIVDSTVCASPSGQRWKIVDDDGATVVSETCSTDKTVTLGAGAYRFVVYGSGDAGTYSFDLAFVPYPDIADLTLTTSPTSVSDGVPAAGLGNIETLASVDVYRFTVPSGGKSVFLDNQGCPFNNAGFSWRLVDRADGSEVHAPENCGSDRKFNLGAGDYQLEYGRNLWNQTGPYQFALFFTPDPQDFVLPVSTSITTISNGNPQTGAGNLETAGSVDRYAFSVPAGGRDLTVNNTACPGYTSQKWKIINIDDNTTVADEFCSSDKQLALAAGSYKFEVSGNGSAGTYAFELSLAVTPDVADLTLGASPTVVSDGVPAPGLGNIETLSSVDAYRFTVPSGGKSVFLDNQGCPHYNVGLSWRLFDRTTNAEVSSDNCGNDKKFDLAAGDYQLEYAKSFWDKTGPYQFALFYVPDPQDFTLSVSAVNTVISNGVPETGSGNLETAGSVDRYSFTVPAGGRDLVVDNTACPSYSGQKWKVVSLSNNATLADEACSTDRTIHLDAGSYRFVVYGNGDAGTYAYAIGFVPEPDVMDLTLSTTPTDVSNGVPVSGAGNIESLASVDVYRFTVPSGGKTVLLDNTVCPYYGLAFEWKLVKQADSSQIASDLCGSDRDFVNLEAGDYRLEYRKSWANQTGIYGFNIKYAN